MTTFTETIRDLRAQEHAARPEWAQQMLRLRNPLVRRVHDCLLNGIVTASGIAQELGTPWSTQPIRAALNVLGLEPLTISEHRLQDLLAQGERSIGYLCERLDTNPLGLWTLFHRDDRYADPHEQTGVIQYKDLTPWCDSEKLARAIFQGKTLKAIGEEVYDGKTRELARLQIRARNLLPLLRERQQRARALTQSED